MAQRIIQICDRCKAELDTSKDTHHGKLQNYDLHHTITISVKNSYHNARNAVSNYDLCPNCENMLFLFLKKET